MMLTRGDLLLILVTAVGCTGAITLLALAVLRWGRRWTIGLQTLVAVVAAVASIVASTAAISAEMYLSAHDLQVLFWVIGVAAVLSLAAAAATARAVRTAVSALRASVARVGNGEVVVAEAAANRELTELSVQLADASQQLAQARAEVERLDASRRQLFSWISHDLRTPMTGISALSEALESDGTDDPRGYLGQIRAQITAMNRLVDDLFELSQIHSGTLRLRLAEVELLDVVSDAVVDVTPLAGARGIRIVHAGVEGRSLRADPHELTRVVANLLTNSIRHAPAGSEVLVTADRDGDRLVLSVLDQGGGVDSEDLTRMFDVGWRASTARTPRTATAADASGAGLGLAIVRGIVEAHGGQVSAENLTPGFRLDVALPAG